MSKEQIISLIDEKIAGQGTNIDAGSVLPAILKGILDLAVAGENVQSDWDEADNTKPDFIKNKPTIPAAQIQSDWNQTDTDAKDFIKNKPIAIPVVDFSDVTIEDNAAEISEEQFYAAKFALLAKTPDGTYLPRDSSFIDFFVSLLENVQAFSWGDGSRVTAMFCEYETDNTGVLDSYSAFIVVAVGGKYYVVFSEF